MTHQDTLKAIMSIFSQQLIYSPSERKTRVEAEVSKLLKLYEPNAQKWDAKEWTND